MSQTGLQRTAQLLQLIQQQFPAIAEASETQGVELTQFLYGTFARSGIQPTAEVWTMIKTLVTLIGPSDRAQAPAHQQPTMAGAVETVSPVEAPA